MTFQTSLVRFHNSFSWPHRGSIIKCQQFQLKSLKIDADDELKNKL